MNTHEHTPRLDPDTAVRSIFEGTATATGEAFFSALVRNLARALETHGAWVTEYLAEERKLRALAFWLGGDFLSDYETLIDGTPCELVIESADLVHFPDNIFELYPEDADVLDTGAVSYMGFPLLGVDGEILGHLAVLDTKPIPEDPTIVAVFKIFAARAAAELQRLRAEAETREREEKLQRLVSGAMDGIIELDPALHVTLVNAAAEKALGADARDLTGQDFTAYLDPESRNTLLGLLHQLDTKPRDAQYLWIPGGLRVLDAQGRSFTAEATLSRYTSKHCTYHALILRNISDRIEAERKIHRLTAQTHYLREELEALGATTTIIGESPAMQQVLQDIAQVAPTNATVLLLGETGAGKELIARTLHEQSPRRKNPLVKVNCAALPAALIESEFFGHEKGAFTGATQQREGRFTLADHGTLFLDEIGELSFDLQAKLLRVLQEGEFEPVGSAHTRKVDVRIIAATNRDLAQCVREGAFREDLYYRLGVFPITLPPLRERPEDIPALATYFLERCARQLGRHMQPLSPAALQRLCAYPWPGNVRELENVIERGIITAVDDQLNLDRALPGAPEASGLADATGTGTGILSAAEIEALERANLLRALEQTHWRVSGPRGAAALLGIPSSTFSSRMKALNLSRPAKRQ